MITAKHTLTKPKTSRIVLLAALCAVLICLSTGCEKQGQTQPAPLSFGTEYQAVFMDNGQTFFGKIENAGTPYPKLSDVFYIQREVNRETNEVKNILVKRGSEWHAPDYMIINSQHIVAIEPVAANSRVAQLIKQAKAQDTGADAAPSPAVPAAPVAPTDPEAPK